MHNEDVPLGSNVITLSVGANVIECANFGNSCCYVETNLPLRCVHTTLNQEALFRLDCVHS